MLQPTDHSEESSPEASCTLFLTQGGFVRAAPSTQAQEVDTVATLQHKLQISEYGRKRALRALEGRSRDGEFLFIELGSVFSI